MFTRIINRQCFLLFLFFICAFALLQNAHAVLLHDQSQMRSAQRIHYRARRAPWLPRCRAADMLGLRGTLCQCGRGFWRITSVEDLKPLLQHATITVDELYRAGRFGRSGRRLPVELLWVTSGGAEPLPPCRPEPTLW